MTKQEKEEKVKQIWSTFQIGGSHAYGIIQRGLKTLGQYDSRLADDVRKELSQEGFDG